jgi:outer membrane protein assembly factor BamB
MHWICALCLLLALPVRADWWNWRGPQQNGTSGEKNLPDTWVVNGTNHLWTFPIHSRGTPVVAGDKVYVWGYYGEEADLQEALACLDAASGKLIWEHRFTDFLSDIVYNRYAIGAPVVDRETGNVYFTTSAGLLSAFTGDGKLLWQHSLMEKFGRLTFPNGRTGAPVVFEEFVIVHGITSNWGRDGAAADRFYAFDKRTGDIVWQSTPGTIPPKDSSFSTPVLHHDVLYCGTGDGSIIALNPRTGEPRWHHKFSAGGVNTSPVIFEDLIVAGHADENLDNSETGRTLALTLVGQEVWRNKEILLTSSPVVAGQFVYLVNKVGELVAIEGRTGKVAWRKKLGPDQLHASPTFADGKLYIPMREGHFFIVRPTETGAEVLSETLLEGELLGAPAIAAGRVYVTSTEKLYCFGSPSETAPVPLPGLKPTPGPVTQIQVVPCEVAMSPGTTRSFRLRGLDAQGNFVKELTGGKWEPYIPPTARVRSKMDAAFNDAGELVVAPDAQLSAGAWEVTVDGVKGQMRGRVVAGTTYRQDFESFAPQAQPDYPPSEIFDWPPLAWIGARFKWDVRDQAGSKVLYKTLDRILFQRASTFIGEPTAKNYTLRADVMSDGNRRMMSNVGIINQRYIVNLVGNWQQLEILSNQDRFKVTAPFQWQPRVWYVLQSRVDVAADGRGVVRAKAWKRGDPEPAEWTLEAPHPQAHRQGSPGIYGFSLQSKFPVYVDNIEVTPND